MYFAVKTVKSLPEVVVSGDDGFDNKMHEEEIDP